MNLTIQKKPSVKSVIRSSETLNESSYQNAINSIRNAIDSLGTVAKSGDSLAKDAIANLSVILFDLQ